MEILTEQGRDLNEDYRHYRAGTFALTANEIHQLGFRTAAAAGHEQIHAINWNTPIDWDQAVTFAQECQPALLEEMWGPLERSTTELTRQVERLSVSAILRRVNDPAELAENHRTYLTKMRIGAAERYVGVDIVKEWYARNMRIFVNLTRLIASPQDRVLVIFGAGHIPLLAQYVRGSGLYTVEQATTYLAIDTEPIDTDREIADA